MRPIAGSESSAFLLSMFESINSEEYRFSSTVLQRHLIAARKEGNETYDCAHPNWFGVGSSATLEVDPTICRFCGFRSQCTLGKVDVEAVTIHGYPGDNLPSEEIIQQCFQVTNSEGRKVRFDPFMAFSLESNMSRDIYAISRSSFNNFYKVSADYGSLQHAVGYDSKYGQPLWPVDQQFLETYLENSSTVRNALSTLESHHNKNYELVAHDQRSLEFISKQLGWLKDDDSAEIKQALELIFIRLSSVLRKIPATKKIANRAMKPIIDHPFRMSGSGLVHLAIRWAQLIPEDIEFYKGKCDPNHRLYESQLRVIDRILPRFSSDRMERERKQYFPRFPMIAMVSEEDVSSLELEHPAGRIIDVVIADVSQPFFLIDGLGVNLLGVWERD